MKLKAITFFYMIVGGYFMLQAQGSLSIYEFGCPIRDYEDNFKNLVKNWKKEYITNAEDYKLNDMSFVEIISGNERYNYYRNYFSSDEPVGSAISGKSGVNSKGNKFYEFIIAPAYAYNEFYDTRGMDEKMQVILTDEFQREAKELLSREINIDTLQLFNVQNYEEQSDTTDTGYSRAFRSYNYTSLALLSQNFKDIRIDHTKTIFDLSLEDARKFVLENLLIERVTRQVAFNENVKPGDKVYAINFDYHMQSYTVYLICSRETKRVVWDTFFGRIPVRKE